jgi:hypothetical protein
VLARKAGNDCQTARGGWMAPQSCLSLFLANQKGRRAATGP